MIKQIINDLQEIYKEHPTRLQHVLGVRDTAVALGKKYQLDTKKLEIAALLHDITKYDSDELTKDIIRKNYQHHEEIIHNFNSKILHAFTARVVAQERYHIKDIDILDSILYHTIGKKEMSMYEKIIFLSDYIEPNRQYESCIKVREIAQHDLDQAVYQAIHDYVVYHKSLNLEIPKQAQDAYRYYKRLEEDHG